MIFDKLDKLAPREKLLMMCAGVFLFAWLVDMVVVESVLSRFKELDRDISTKNKVLKLYNKQLQIAGEVDKEYAVIKDLVVKDGTSAEVSDDMYADVVDLARRTNLDCPSMEAQDCVKGQFFETYYVRIGQFNATLENLATFLHEIRVFPGMFKVTQLSINYDKKANAVKGSMMITKVMMESGD